jgi:hypothetical protein
MKQLLVLLLLLCAANVSAQDVIVKKDGSTVVCRVVEVTATEITYKKWSNLNGSNYVMDKSLASAINYESGKKETFGKTESLYMPNNQNDGMQKYNDKALLKLDAASHKSPSYKAANIMKIIGWGIGAGALVTGIYFMGASGHSHYQGMGAGIILGGVIWTSGCLLLAKHLAKKGEAIESASIYQYDFKIDNSSTLSAGIDLLSDCTQRNNTLGLGLRYNF